MKTIFFILLLMLNTTYVCIYVYALINGNLEYQYINKTQFVIYNIYYSMSEVDARV